MQLAFSNCYLLNASGASIAFKKLNTVNSERHNFGDEIWTIKDQSLEHPPCLNTATQLCRECHAIHILPYLQTTTRLSPEDVELLLQNAMVVIVFIDEVINNCHQLRIL